MFKNIKRFVIEKKDFFSYVSIYINVFPIYVLISLSIMFVILGLNYAKPKQNKPTGKYYIVYEDDKQEEASEQNEVVSSEVNTNEWASFQNSVYGYSFKYPSDSNVQELSFDACQRIDCRKNGDVALLDSINISSFYTQISYFLSYNEGLDKEKYKEPVETTIGGEKFYYIISKEGYIDMIVKEYKYIENLLWVKTLYKVDKANNSYYIEFDKTIIPVEISESKIERYNQIFNTFKF
jgi:hypothetical protein